MGGELLAEYLLQKIQQKHPEVQIQDEYIEDIVFKNPFHLTEEIFDDILPTVETNEFYAISYIGSQGHGKSYSASGFATKAKAKGFMIIYAKAADIFPDLKGWIEKVKEKLKKHGNPKVCFVYDDMSYTTGTISSKAAAKFKNFIADMRHEFEQVFGTIQILIIYISHRYHSVPPMLRNSATWVFASMQPEDRLDAMKLIPNHKEQKDKLESIYVFLSKVTQDGPKYTNLKFNLGENEFNFRWGKKGDPGDGRLMMSFHRGELRIFNAKEIEGMINLEDYRIKYEPPTPPTEDEIIAKKQRLDIAFRKKAEEITSNLNNKKLEITEELFPIKTEF